MIKIQTFSKENFVINEWSGGKTTQLAIYPKESSLSKRDFMWRISSASFTSKESRFSDFSGYQRYILPLKGSISLFHADLYERVLKPYDVEYFLGKWTTDSTNTLDCIDFNFIVKEGISCNLSILKQAEDYIPKRGGVVCLYSLSDFVVDFICEGVNSVKVTSNDLIICEEQENLSRIIIKKNTSPVILCEVNF